MSKIIEKLRGMFHAAVLVLDGATGTELERRGAPTPAPLWSAAALLTHPHVIRAIHREYREAGVDIIVADTFRTNIRSLRAADMPGRGLELNRLAVQLAREPGRSGADSTNEVERAGRRPLVAGSVGPVEDCYIPALNLDEQTFHAEHVVMMDWLKQAGVDLVWIETMNNATEARAAARAAFEARLPFVVSFVLAESGNLLSNELLEKAVEAVEPFAPLALGLNCIPPDGITAHLPRLRRLTERPLAAYAHIDNVDPIPGWSYSQTASPGEYAEHAVCWIDLGATIVGGCCGTTPAHIRAVRAAIQ